jgi:O-antigen/teichoic acid export membrane protein
MSGLTIVPQAEPVAEQPTATDSILTAAKGGGIMFAGTMIEYVGRFALGLLLARLMGDEQYGLYSLTGSAVYLMIGIAPLGLGTAVLHFVPIFASRRDQRALQTTLQIGLALPTLVSLLIGVAFYIFANAIALTVFHDARLTLLLRIAAISVPCGTLAAMAVSATQGFKQMKYKVIAQDILLTMLKVVLTALLAITGLSAIKAMTAYSAAMVVSCIVMLYFLSRITPLKPSLRWDLPHTRQMLKFSLPVYIAELLTMFGPDLRTLLLGSLNTIRAVGIFTVASRVNMVGSAFLNSISTMSMPIVSELHANKEREKLRHFYQTMNKWTFSLNLPVFLLILLFTRPILLLFGESFVSGSTGLVILAIGNLVSAATGICGVLIIMTDNVWLNTANSVVKLVSTLALSVWLIPTGGALGAATATAASIILVNILLTIEVFALFRLLPYNRSLVKPVIAGILSALATYATIHGIFKSESLGSVALGVAVCLTVYLGATLLLGLSDEDRVVLRRLGGRLSRIPVLGRWL